VAATITVTESTFLQRYQAVYGKLSPKQMTGLSTLLGFLANDTEVNTQPRWIAYMLATVKHEVGDTWHPIREYGNNAYFIRRYWSNEKVRMQLGNLREDDAWAYCGRGYVQVTGRRNYRTFAGLTGVDLVANPDKALEPSVSYFILSHGMRHGKFTGRYLGEFLDERKHDFLNARRCVNGTDRAGMIADYATMIERMLTE
jgi:putative chitinase